jgi:hypothetical protein
MGQVGFQKNCIENGSVWPSQVFVIKEDKLIAFSLTETDLLRQIIFYVTELIYVDTYY